MTDKQIPNERRQYEYKSIYPEKLIIIDGVDVSRCIHYKATGKYNTCGYYCEQNPNCYYKQLKRSEAQCEGMFVSHTDLEKKYKAKEQECERLKNEIEFCYSQVEDFDIIATSKSNKLKQAEQRLERIRQMLKNGVKIHDDIVVNKSILQIIDEVIPNEN